MIHTHTLRTPLPDFLHLLNLVSLRSVSLRATSACTLCPTACWPGYGPGPGPDGTCPACAAGTAKKLIGTEGCTNCLYGFIANANAGATDCLDAHGDPEETCAHTPLPVYIEAVNSCGCEAGSYLVLPFTNGKDDCATCEECPGNTIAPEDGALECEECPEGTVANYDKTECVEGSYGGYSPKDDDHEEEEHEEEEEEEEKEKYEKKEKVRSRLGVVTLTVGS